PKGNVVLHGCGEQQRLWVPTDPRLNVQASGPCEIVAIESSGMTQVSDPITIDPALGDQLVEIVLPYEDAGGLALEIRDQPDGYRVVTLVPGSEAADLLEPNDLIVAIDGESTVGMPFIDFLRRDAGPR